MLQRLVVVLTIFLAIFADGCSRYAQDCAIMDARCNAAIFALAFRRLTESRFAYVAVTAGTIYEYSVSRTNGTLTQIGTVPGAGAGATALTMDPQSRFLFAVSATATNVSSYTINSRTGALSLVGTYTVGAGAVQAAVDPLGRYLYVSDSTTTTVHMFSIDQTTGALTGIAGGTFTVLTGPQIPAFDSFGRYAYISTNSVPRVNLLNILSDGSLSNIAAAITPGASPLQGSIDPLNHALYVPNNGAGTISMYTIGSDGSLNSLGTVSPGGAPSTLTIDPTGRFLYREPELPTSGCIRLTRPHTRSHRSEVEPLRPAPIRACSAFTHREDLHTLLINPRPRCICIRSTRLQEHSLHFQAHPGRLAEQRQLDAHLMRPAAISIRRMEGDLLFLSTT